MIFENLGLWGIVEIDDGSFGSSFFFEHPINNTKINKIFEQNVIEITKTVGIILKVFLRVEKRKLSKKQKKENEMENNQKWCQCKFF